MMDIQAWLTKLGLPQYCKAFADNAVTVELLPNLTAEDLKEIGVLPVGHRRRLLAAIESLGEEARLSSTTHTASAPPLTSAHPEAERRHLTVMFCDLVGSTVLARQLDPEAMRDVLLSYQNTVAGEIGRMEGNLAKFMGDGVVAYFGYPIAHEDDAERAVRAGLAIASAVGKLTTPNGATLAVRTGIASGLVVVGDVIGANASLEHAVIGETPNLASRLQTIAEPGQVVISSETRDLLAGLFVVGEINVPALKGIAADSQAFAVLGESSVESRFEARRSRAIGVMVGRDQELEFLRERWAMARSADGQVVLVVGEPGIGKSRLIRALSDAVVGEEHVRLLHQCSPHHSDSALYPIAQRLMRSATFERNDGNDVGLNKLEQLVGLATVDVRETAALLAPLVDLDGEARYGKLDLTPAQQRSRTFDVLLDQLLGLAKRKPVLCIFEDVHWVDPTTLEFLDLCLEKIADAPVLMILTARPTFQHGFGGHPIVTRLSLNRLGRAQISAIASRFAGGKRFPDEVLQIIMARTDGVPLFVEELTKTILESGIVHETDDALTLSQPLSMLSVPTSLHDSLMARLGRDQEAKEVAQVASCIGREFDYELLSAICRVGEDKLKQALVHLVQSELLYVRGRPPNAMYVFKHALVRDAAYESLLKTRRQSVHGEIAKYMELQSDRLTKTAPEVIAFHYSKAGQAVNAITWWTAAGNRALQQSANLEAIQHFNAGLPELAGVTDELRAKNELTIQLGLGNALTATKGYSDVATGNAFQRARQLAETLGDIEKLFPILYGIWNYDNVASQHRSAKVTAVELLNLAKRHGETGPLLAAYSALGAWQNFTAAFRESLVSFGACIALYDEATHRLLGIAYSEDPCVQAFILGAQSHWHLGFPDRARASVRDGLALAERTKHMNSIGFALVATSIVDCLLDDRPTARKSSEVALARLADKRLPGWEAVATICAGWGHSDSARIEAGISQWRALGCGVLVPLYLGFLADVHISSGNPEEALRRIDEALAFVVATDEAIGEAELYRLKGAALLQAQPHERNQVKELLNLASEVAGRQEALSTELRIGIDMAKLLRDEGNLGKAKELLGGIYGRFTEGFSTPNLIKAKALLDELTEGEAAPDRRSRHS